MAEISQFQLYTAGNTVAGAYLHTGGIANTLDEKRASKEDREARFEREFALFNAIGPNSRLTKDFRIWK